jgi:hypothetical protein
MASASGRSPDRLRSRTRAAPSAAEPAHQRVRYPGAEAHDTGALGLTAQELVQIGLGQCRALDRNRANVQDLELARLDEPPGIEHEPVHDEPDVAEPDRRTVA